MTKSFLYYCKELIRGRVQFQRFYILLYKVSLLGMNFGGGSNVESSGEVNAIKYFLKKIPVDSGVVIFDVGAHLGNYSMMLLEILKSMHCSIYAFEPSKVTFLKLQANLQNKKISLYNLGFGDENKKANLFYDYDTSVFASVYKRHLDHNNIKMDFTETIEMRTIDSFCAQNNIPHIHFLKIDAEGNEMNILKGAAKMLKNKKIDFIQFEFGSCNIDSRTYFKDFYYLLKENYTIYRILKNGLYLIDKYRETEEIFLTTNYLAERNNIT